MPRVSAADKLERRLIEDLEQQAFDPDVPAYVRHRCKATLATMLHRRDKRLEAEAKAKAARKAAQPVVYPNVLPPNGRGPNGSSAPPAAPAFDLGAFLDAKAINRG